MTSKAIGGAAALALAAGFCMAPAGGGSILSEDLSKIDNCGDLPHLALYGGADRTKVPEPATLLISGISLLSLGLAHRKKG